LEERIKMAGCDISLLIVNYNTSHLLKDMMSALTSSIGDFSLEIVMLDNASKDDSAAKIRQDYPSVDLLENDKNVGFGRANNQALELATGRYILLLNTDAFVSPDTLKKTLEYMESHPECGVLGVKLLGRDGELQPSCRYFPTPWNIFLSRTGFSRFFPQTKLVDDMSWNHDAVRECDWVPGCYYLIRRQVIDQVGLFDPRFFLYYEEVDHCKRVKQAGWQVIYYPDTSVVHIGGESAKTDNEISTVGRQIPALQIESELLYFRKHYGLLGLLLHFFLIHLGSVMLVMKGILKGQGKARLSACWQQLRMSWRLLRKTHMATRPTK